MSYEENAENFSSSSFLFWIALFTLIYLIFYIIVLFFVEQSDLLVIFFISKKKCTIKVEKKVVLTVGVC